jgi:radical SAM protein with 4Fe4S-binding SPASM domain
MELGEIPIESLNEIVRQFKGDIIQFNKDGEPLLYPKLWLVGEICKPFVTNIVTNGKLLWEKRTELVDNFTSICVSVFEDDEQQKEAVMKFAEYKGDRSPQILIKFLGGYDDTDYHKFTVLRRSLHHSKTDTLYAGSKPPVPEVGVCLDFLYKPSIDWKGDMYMCNRYDPEGLGKIGNTFTTSLEDIWNGDKRNKMLKLHKEGKREEIEMCKKCEYWGFPTNG